MLKMWFLLIIILLVPVKGYVHECETDPKEFCNVFTPSPNDIPANEEELHRLCPIFDDKLECLHSYNLSCNGRSQFVALNPPLEYSRIRIFLDDACGERKDVHKVLGLSLPCIKSRITGRNILCSKSMDNVFKGYEEYYNTHSSYRRRVQGSIAKRLRRECLYDVYTTGCVLKDIEKECGYRAYVAGMSAIGTNILVDRCGLDVFQELAEILDYISIDRKTKDILKDLFIIRH